MQEQNYKEPMKKKKKIMWISIAGILIILIGVGGFLAVNRKLSQKEYTEKISLADKYFSEKDYDKAIIEYQAAIKADPTNEKAYLQLATIYVEMSDMNKAKHYLNMGIGRVSSPGRLQLMLNKILDGRLKPKPQFEEVAEEEEEEEKEENETVKISGVVVNAVTGEGVRNAEIVAVSTDKKKKDQQGSTKSKSNGEYELELPTGEYLVTIYVPDFMEESFELKVKEKPIRNNNYTVSPELATGEIRIVLEWGAEPADLDAHLTTTSGECVDFANRVVTKGGKEVANLDVDDRNGYGPETITISQQEGEFTYWVHDFTRSNQIGSSGAIVKVYLPGETPIVYQVPAGEGIMWEVCKIKDGKVTAINTVTDRDLVR